jgi:Putative beta barrel porin-7 (BBP7)
MKSFYARGILFALGLASFNPFSVNAESFGSASLLPVPSEHQLAEPQSVLRTNYNRRNYQEDLPSHSDVRPNTATPVVEPLDSAPMSNGHAPSYQSGAANGSGCLSPDYQQAMQQSWGESQGGTCSDGSCGESYGTDIGGSCKRWFVQANGLYMGRANQTRYSVTQDINTYNTIMTTEDAGQDFAGGFETRLGRLLGCNGCNAFEIGYWGIFPSDQSASRQAGGYPTLGIGPLLGNNLNLLSYDDGTYNYDVRTWMTTTTGMHELRRSYDFNSFEANFLGNSYAWGLQNYQVGCGCGPRWQFGWLAGFRYFNYGESTTFYSDYDDNMIDNDPNELRYNLRTKNDLVGFQLGGQGNWQVNNCWSIFGSGRAGVFNNHITHTQRLYGSNGDAIINAGAYTGQPYWVDSSRDSLAAIGQFDLGVRYNWSCRLSVQAGYRVVGIAGVATSDGQIADNFADPRMAGVIRASDSVILHGGFFGGTFTF